MKTKLLTERERMVLILLALGLSEEEVGKKIGFSRDTVHDDRGRIYKKMGHHNFYLVLVAAIVKNEISLEELSFMYRTYFPF